MSAAPKSASSSMPIRGPIPLSASQEAQVREMYYANVRKKCADEIREFAQCVTGRTVTMTWVCRHQRRTMESCMNGYATQQEQDAAREEWFATLDERRNERRRKLAVAERLHREWWDLEQLPNQDEDTKKK